MSFASGDVWRYGSPSTSLVHVGIVFQQHLHKLQVSKQRCYMQCGIAMTVDSWRVSTWQVTYIQTPPLSHLLLWYTLVRWCTGLRRNLGNCWEWSHIYYIWYILIRASRYLAYNYTANNWLTSWLVLMSGRYVICNIIEWCAAFRPLISYWKAS